MYRANKESPIFDDLRGLIMKTVGLVEPIQSALRKFRTQIRFAFVYGSVAKGLDTSKSDIDLIIVGSGSGNMIPDFLSDWKIALVERDVFGGTCLNRGCIPSKMFVVPADVALIADHSAKLGIDTQFNGADWAKQGAKNLKAAMDKCDSNKEAGDKNRAFNEGVIRKQYASVTDHQTLANKIHLQMESIYPWSVWGVAVATQGSGDTAKCHVW